MPERHSLSDVQPDDPSRASTGCSSSETSAPDVDEVSISSANTPRVSLDYSGNNSGNDVQIKEEYQSPPTNMELAPQSGGGS
jgi:hypothetical protein